MHCLLFCSLWFFSFNSDKYRSLHHWQTPFILIISLSTKEHNVQSTSIEFKKYKKNMSEECSYDCYVTCENQFACRTLHLLRAVRPCDVRMQAPSHHDEPREYSLSERNEDILTHPLMCNMLSSNLFYLSPCALVERDLFKNTKEIIYRSQ